MPNGGGENGPKFSAIFFSHVRTIIRTISSYLYLFILFYCIYWSSFFVICFSPVFAITFAITRLYIYPRYVLYEVIFESPKTFGSDWIGYWAFAVLLSILQVLHIFWYSLIAKMIYKLVTTGIEKDERSDDEDEIEDRSKKNKWIFFVFVFCFSERFCFSRIFNWKLAVAGSKGFRL